MKVGDKVVEFGQWGSFYYYTIERETKTRWITNTGQHWHKSTLLEVGRSSFSRIHEITPEVEKDLDLLTEQRDHESAWIDIRDIKRPHHLPASRLKEILAELKGNG